MKKMLWAGRVVSAVPVFMLLLSGGMKLARLASILEAFAHFGYPVSLAVAIGALEIACTLVYVIPRTAFLGAILMTAYLGGATATNVRVGDSVVIPVALGVLVWAGLFLRDGRLRELVLLRP